MRGLRTRVTVFCRVVGGARPVVAGAAATATAARGALAGAVARRRSPRPSASARRESSSVASSAVRRSRTRRRPSLSPSPDLRRRRPPRRRRRRAPPSPSPRSRRRRSSVSAASVVGRRARRPRAAGRLGRRRPSRPPRLLRGGASPAAPAFCWPLRASSAAVFLAAAVGGWPRRGRLGGGASAAAPRRRRRVARRAAVSPGAAPVLRRRRSRRDGGLVARRPRRRAPRPRSPAASAVTRRRGGSSGCGRPSWRRVLAAVFLAGACWRSAWRPPSWRRPLAGGLGGARASAGGLGGRLAAPRPAALAASTRRSSWRRPSVVAVSRRRLARPPSSRRLARPASSARWARRLGGLGACRSVRGAVVVVEHVLLLGPGVRRRARRTPPARSGRRTQSLRWRRHPPRMRHWWPTPPAAVAGLLSRCHRLAGRVAVGDVTHRADRWCGPARTSSDRRRDGGPRVDRGEYRTPRPDRAMPTAQRVADRAGRRVQGPWASRVSSGAPGLSPATARARRDVVGSHGRRPVPQHHVESRTPAGLVGRSTAERDDRGPRRRTRAAPSWSSARPSTSSAARNARDRGRDPVGLGAASVDPPAAGLQQVGQRPAGARRPR